MKRKLDLFEYNDNDGVGRLRTITPSQEIAIAEKLEANMMTKAQFNALADERKANRAGSGFDNFGSNFTGVNTIYNINQGLNTFNVTDNIPNSLLFSVEDVTSSKTPDGYPFAIINGVRQKLKSIGANYNKIQLPTAPNIYPYDTVLTAEQIAMGVIKHADSSNSGLIVNGKFNTNTSGWYKAPSYESTAVISNGKLRVTATGAFGRYLQAIPTVIGKTYIVNGEATLISGGGGALISLTNSNGNDITINVKTFVATSSTSYISCSLLSAGDIGEFDNIAVYPADAISRSDLVFLESWHEDISEKNFVYPLGNVQYLGANTDSLTGIANGAFTGFETYSLFGNWQTPSALIGKGYVWSSLTEAQKKAFIANPDNNCYLDGDKVIQVRYRVRVVQGAGDSWDYPFYNMIDGGGSNPTGSTVTYNTSSNFYIKPKGKLNSITYDLTGYNSYETGFFANKNYKSITTNYEIGMATAVNKAATSLDISVAYEGKCFALPIALVHR